MPVLHLRCGHTFHEVCLEECRKARVIDSVQAVKCPTCGLTDSDMAEKKPAAQFLGAGEASSPSVPEILKSQKSRSDNGTPTTQAAWQTQVHPLHGSKSLVAARNSPVTVAVPVPSSVASDRDPQGKRCKWADTQDVPVERKGPGIWSPEKVGPRDLEAPKTPVRSQPMILPFTPDSQLSQN